MKWLQNAYTRRFNTRHRAWGRLFGDRYKAVLVEGGTGYYYETLLDYIHLNPVRAGLVRASRGQSVLDYHWSSVGGGHALSPGRRPGWLATEDALGAFGYSDTARGRREWVARPDRRALEEQAERCGVVLPVEPGDGRYSHLRRGWYWGSQEFAERMLKLAKAALGRSRSRSYRASPARKAHDASVAEALLAEGLQAAALTDDDLLRLPGSEPRKVAVARVIWEQTTVPQSWLAEKLMMGSPANVSQQLRRSDLPEARRSLPRNLRNWLVAVKKC